LLPNRFCSAVGNPGDLILFDPSDFVVCFHQMNNESPLSFSVELPDDSYHRGVRGLPFDAIEQRASDQQFFSTDLLQIVWKMRLDAKFLWNQIQGPPPNFTTFDAAKRRRARERILDLERK
jgi:hypothetical protein